MSGRALLLGALVAMSACRRPATEQSPPSASAPPDGAPSPAPDALVASSAPSPDAGVTFGTGPDAARADGPRLPAAPWGAVQGARPLGHTSLVFRLTTAAGPILFKSRFTKGPSRWRGEVAGYRLAVALGIGARVPEAIPYAAPRAPLEATAAFRDGGIVEGDGTVHGAAIAWVPALSFYPLEKAPRRAAALAELVAGHPYAARAPQPGPLDPAEDREGRTPPDAEEVSTLVAFDWLTANFDRWSGGNVGRDDRTGRLLYLDNDGAFLDPPPKGPLDRQWALVQGIDRFSKGFVARLRALDGERLRGALGTDLRGQPLLAGAVLEGVLHRRQTLLTLIDGKLKTLGPEVVLSLP